MDLGTIRTLALRDLWPGEATHFTPWLSKNLDLLGSKLGMDLELEKIEGAAGDFSADIIARDLSTNRLVVIENQFGSTDHRHLGSSLTYAAVLGAGALVWIAESVRAEHQTTLEFLNRNLKEGGLSLFAVQASAIRIDGSRPAFILNVVTLPAEAPVTIDEAGKPLSDTRTAYRAYFQALIDELREKYAFTNARAGQPQNWYTFASENSSLYKFGTSFGAGGRVRVEVYIDCGDKDRNERLFDCLNARKDLITAAAGVDFDWQRLDSRRASRIAIHRDGSIDDDTQALADIRAWVIKHLLLLKEIFPTHIRQCDMSMSAAGAAMREA